jgi:hypothetical protein
VLEWALSYVVWKVDAKITQSQVKTDSKSSLEASQLAHCDNTPIEMGHCDIPNP